MFVRDLDDSNIALSVTCAAALVNIDPSEATPILIPRLVLRADWPSASVAKILKFAGPDRVTIPICNAILTSDVPTAVRLLRYSELLRAENVEQLIEEILRERSEPAVLAAALKAVSGSSSVPGILRLARHEAWYVRMQSARLLGRFGQHRDLPELERLLCDSEWWVRYRAAQAIVSLPCLDPRMLRALADRQTDRFAVDMMRHAMAEAGL
jgi:HEAT repeat protein